MKTKKWFSINCPRYWVILVVLLIASVIVGGAGVLRFRNPQADKYSYIFQRYVSPAIQPQLPDNYTGIWNVWNGHGVLLESTAYRKGEHHGPHIEWSASGKKLLDINYVDGELSGEYSTWQEDGQLAVRGVFIDGVKDGTWTTFGINGVRSTEWVYDYGMKVSYKVYYPSAKPQRLVHYDDGTHHGKMIEWNEEGDIESVEYYLHGKKVSESIWLTHSSKSVVLEDPSIQNKKEPQHHPKTNKHP